MDTEKKKKVFPAYFSNFQMPEQAREQVLEVYRGCPTRKVERESFLNSFEQNGFKLEADEDSSDPSAYSLSTYTDIKRLKRFLVTNPQSRPEPWTIAKGITSPDCGLSCLTREYKPQKRDKHVDWWLYEGAEPWKYFVEVNYEDEVLRRQHNP